MDAQHGTGFTQCTLRRVGEGAVSDEGWRANPDSYAVPYEVLSHKCARSPREAGPLTTYYILHTTYYLLLTTGY